MVGRGRHPGRDTDLLQGGSPGRGRRGDQEHEDLVTPRRQACSSSIDASGPALGRVGGRGLSKRFLIEMKAVSDRAPRRRRTNAGVAADQAALIQPPHEPAGPADFTDRDGSTGQLM